MSLFQKWYDEQTGFYWDWLKQVRNAENGWRKTYEKEALKSRETIKKLKEELEIKKAAIRYLEIKNGKLESDLYLSRNKMYDV